MWLYLAQPIVRGWQRHAYVLGRRRLPRQVCDLADVERQAKRFGRNRVDLYWESSDGSGRDELLAELIAEASDLGWSGEFGNEWDPWDLELMGDRWHDVIVRTATEVHAWPKRFTRARCTLHLGFYGRVGCVAASVWAGASVWSLKPWAVAFAFLLMTGFAWSILRSKIRCRKAVSMLLWSGGLKANLKPFHWRNAPEVSEDRLTYPAPLNPFPIPEILTPMGESQLVAE
jgi:hypothetical protein